MPTEARTRSGSANPAGARFARSRCRSLVGRGAGAHAAVRVSRGTEGLVFRGGVPQSQYDVMRAPFQGGRLPRPGEVRLPQRRRRRPRSRRAPGAHRLLSLPPPDGVRRAGRRRDQPVQLSLGGAFHSGRLGIRAGRVGDVAVARRGRRTTAERRALALDLLEDPAFDALLTGASTFDELPDVMARLSDGRLARSAAR